METIDVLNKMKDVLIENGWCKTELQHPNGNVCLIGARNKVMGVLNTQLDCQSSYRVDSVSEALENVMPIDCQRKHPSEDTTRAWMYNDRYAYSVNDVLAIIDDAIIAEKERERGVD